MREEWKADVVKDLYRYEVTRDELATEMGVSVSYVNMVLTGARKGKSAEEKMRSALEKIVARKVVESK